MRLVVLCLLVSACQAPAARPISSHVQPGPTPYKPKGRIIIVETQIEALDKIGFFGGSATLTPESAHQLDALAETLEHDDSIATLEVQAYAGDVPQMFQQPLSEQRARRLVDYLVRRGVDRKRLMPVGIGPAPAGSDNRPAFFISRR